jgi:biotin carboxyl carrier protein
MKYTVTVAGRSVDIEVDHDQLVRVNGHPLYVDLEQVGGLPLYSLALDDAGYVVFVEEGQGEYRVEVQGEVIPVAVQSQRPRLVPGKVECSDGNEACLIVRAPLAGHLISLPVSAQNRVEAGQIVAVVESMKMKMELKAPQAGVVEGVHATPEQDVDQGEQLVTIRTGQ